MEFNDIEYNENRNLIPLEIPNKKDYYTDLFQLENSFVSRLDIFQIATTFIKESVQLITNAISLFEQGYLDCAYYSLRQSLETTLTLVYLANLQEQEREKELLKWKEKSIFPMYNSMVKSLEEQKAIFLDVKEKMPIYFDGIKSTKKLLNKHVHKQGFDTFYVSRNHFLNQERDQAPVIEEFEFCLKKCVGAVVVFRLCIDPFPILLMDPEIYSRTQVFMSDAFTSKFVEKYVGFQNIEDYKQTDLYKSVYDHFINLEKRLPSVLDLTKNAYIDKSKTEEIISQIHLLRTIEIQAVAIAMMSEKVTRIILSNFTTESFFTSTPSIRKNWGFTVEKYLEFRNISSLLNYSIDNAFISSISVGEETFFIEHNEKYIFEEFEEFKSKVTVTFNKLENSKNM